MSGESAAVCRKGYAGLAAFSEPHRVCSQSVGDGDAAPLRGGRENNALSNVHPLEAGSSGPPSRGYWLTYSTLGPSDGISRRIRARLPRLEGDAVVPGPGEVAGDGSRKLRVERHRPNHRSPGCIANSPDGCAKTVISPSACPPNRKRSWRSSCSRKSSDRPASGSRPATAVTCCSAPASRRLAERGVPRAQYQDQAAAFLPIRSASHLSSAK